MHSTGSMKSWSTASNPGRPSSYCVSFFGWMQSTGQASTHAVSFVPMQGSAMIYAIVPSQRPAIPHRHGGCSATIKRSDPRTRRGDQPRRDRPPLALARLVGELYEKNRDQFKDREAVFNLFGDAVITGNVLRV